MKKVLLVASGLSAKQVHDYPYSDNGWVIVSVNNGWQACDYWDFWLHSNDFNGDRPSEYKSFQREVKKYGPALKKFGGQQACGFSIALNAAYWALAELQPDVIGFLGADMNYTPTAEGHTSIYGVGNDIKKNGIPDPDRMVKVHGNSDPNYLNDIYMRLLRQAEGVGCAIYNLSTDKDTRLPYPKASPEIL